MNSVYALQYAPTAGLRRWNWRWTEPSDLAYQPVSVDVHDDGEAFVISALMPGVAADDLKIEIEGDTISLRGEIKADKAEADRPRRPVPHVPGARRRWRLSDPSA